MLRSIISGIRAPQRLHAVAGSVSQTPARAGVGGSLAIGACGLWNQFIQGAITTTGSENDIAISGEGFFVVRDPVSGATYVTRAGNFQLDSNGYLVTATAMHVLGYDTPRLATIGDIKVDNSGAPGGSSSEVQSHTFEPDGKVTVMLADRTRFVRGQVLLQKFQTPQSLSKKGNNLYSARPDAGPLARLSEPNTNGLGFLVGKSLEMSNVNLSNEFSRIITSQSRFETNSRTIKSGILTINDRNEHP